MENDGGFLSCVYAAHRDEYREFWIEVRSICVVLVALVEVCSMGIMRFELKSLEFIGSVSWDVYGGLTELFGFCSIMCGRSTPKLCMDGILRCVGRALDMSRVGLFRYVGE